MVDGDDFASFTPQEKFMMMLAERVGTLEETMHKMMHMMGDVHKFMVTKSIRSYFDMPMHVHVDAAILPRIVAAVQKDKFLERI